MQKRVCFFITIQSGCNPFRNALSAYDRALMHFIMCWSHDFDTLRGGWNKQLGYHFQQWCVTAAAIYNPPIWTRWYASWSMRNEWRILSWSYCVMLDIHSWCTVYIDLSHYLQVCMTTPQRLASENCQTKLFSWKAERMYNLIIADKGTNTWCLCAKR